MHSSAARVLWQAPGSPLFPVPLVCKRGRRAERRDGSSVSRAPFARSAGASRRAVAAISDPGSALPSTASFRPHRNRTCEVADCLSPQRQFSSSPCRALVRERSETAAF